MKGYKGFDRDLRCRKKQYAIGGTFTEPEAVLCQSGMHFCEELADCFSHYPPTISRYCEIEARNVSEAVNDYNERTADTKRVAKEITVVKELDMFGIAEAIAGVDLDAELQQTQEDENEHTTINKELQGVAASKRKNGAAVCTENVSAAVATGYGSAALSVGTGGAAVATDDCSVASCEGYQSIAAVSGGSSVTTNTGDIGAAISVGDLSAALCSGKYGAAMTLGDNSTASASGNFSLAISAGVSGVATAGGKASVAIASGIYGKASGQLGNWLILFERDNDWNILDIKAVEVDGKDIRPGVSYTLYDGQITETE